MQAGEAIHPMIRKVLADPVHSSVPLAIRSCPFVLRKIRRFRMSVLLPGKAHP
jgi:hypothetical protein